MKAQVKEDTFVLNDANSVDTDNVTLTKKAISVHYIFLAYLNIIAL